MNKLTNSMTSTVSKAPIWLWAAAAFGLIWNVYGVYQFAGTFSQTGSHLSVSKLRSAAARA